MMKNRKTVEKVMRKCKRRKSGGKSQFIGEVSLDSILDSNQKLRILAFFNSTIRSAYSLLSGMKCLSVRIFRGYDIMDDVKEILDLENLTVLEISGPSYEEILPDNFF